MIERHRKYIFLSGTNELFFFFLIYKAWSFSSLQDSSRDPLLNEMFPLPVISGFCRNFF